MSKKYNIGILAHVDAGKTSITEQLLRVSGAIRTMGSVDAGTTITDYMEVERRRGISVRNACVSLSWKNAEIQIIDTPGHVDFSGEVERSLRALDGAVLVISAVEGVQAQTRAIFRALQTMRIPTILVCNKIDRVGFEREDFEKKLRKELTSHFVPLDNDEEILAGVSEFDEEMEEAFLMEEMPERELLLSRLREWVLPGEICPLLYASAKEGKGIEEILDAVITYLPDTGSCETGELSGYVFQLQFDDVMGKVAFVRLYGGKLKARDIVTVAEYKENEENNADTSGAAGENAGGSTAGKSSAANEGEKITQIRRIRGGRFEDTGEMFAGDIAAVCGLSGIRVGDWIGSINPLKDNSAMHVKPLLLTEAKPSDPQDAEALTRALTMLSQEDPLLEYEFNTLTGQQFVHIMGDIQTEVLTEIIKTRFGLSVTFTRPEVIYKEKPARTAEGLEAYTMPKPCWAIVQLRIEPLPKGSGIQFVSAIKEGELPIRYQNHVRESVFKTLKQGIYGWEVIDSRVTLVMGNHHHVHTHPLDFFVATPIAVLRALTGAGSRLMEPYMLVHMEAEEELLGKVMGQVINMRGEFDPPASVNGRFVMNAVMPLKDCMEYPSAFRSLTSGKGLISMELLDYRPCEQGDMHRFPRNGVDPLDRAKWILACRSALGKDLTGR